MRSQYPFPTGLNRHAPKLLAIALACTAAVSQAGTASLLGSGAWGNPGIWANGKLPGSTDEVLTGAACGTPSGPCLALSVTTANGLPGNYSVHSLNLPTTALTVGSGAYLYYGHGQIGGLQLDGGTLASGTGGSLIIGSDSYVNPSTVLRGGILTGGPDFHGITQLVGGAGDFSIRGGNSLAYTASNHGSFSQSGSGELQLWFGASFLNAAGASFDIQNNAGIQVLNPFQNYSRFTNAAGATFSKSAGSGFSSVDVVFNNAGLVRVDAGALQLAAGGNHLGGTFEVNGSSALYLKGAHSFDGSVSTQGNASSWREAVQIPIDGVLTVQSTGSWNHSTSLGVDGVLKQLGTASNSGSINVHLGGEVLNTGSWTHQGSFFSNGTVTNQGSFVAQGNFGLGDDGQFNNQAGATLKIAGAFESGSAATLVNEGSLLISNPVYTGGQFRGTLDNRAGATLSVTSRVDGQATVLNAGTLTVASGVALVAQSLTQTAGQLTVDGQLSTYGGKVTLQGGTLNGNGVINGDLFVGGGPDTAYFKPGHSPGHFTVDGNFTLAQGSELQLEVERLADGSLAWDQLTVATGFEWDPASGQYVSTSGFFDGTVHLIVGPGVASTQLQSFDKLISCSVGICMFGGNFNLVIDGVDKASYSYRYDFHGLSLDLALAPVPEPSAAWLLSLGLLSLAWRRRSAC